MSDQICERSLSESRQVSASERYALSFVRCAFLRCLFFSLRWQCPLPICQRKEKVNVGTRVPRYTLDRLPSYLKTLPQLRTQGLKSSQQVADGCYYRRLAPNWLFFYDIRKALPLEARLLPRLRSRLNRWLQRYDRCQWCGWSAPSDTRLHLSLDGLCAACHFEQEWLRQCKQIVVWAQERLHSEQVIILDTETVGSLNDLDLSELVQPRGNTPGV